MKNESKEALEGAVKGYEEADRGIYQAIASDHKELRTTAGVRGGVD